MKLRKISKYFVAFTLVLLIVWTALLFWGHYTIDKLPTDKSENHLRILSMNVSAGNVLGYELQKEIINAKPDIIVIVEWTGDNLNLADFNAAGYKTVLNHPRKKVHGLCILSQFDGETAIIESPVETPCALPLGRFRFKWNDSLITLFAVHAPPPVPACKGTTNDYLVAISNWITNGKLNQDLGSGKQGDLTILAGDFNSISFSGGIEKIKNKGLLDSYSKYSFTNQTWKPFKLFPCVVKIDYILFADRFKSVNNFRFAIKNSDHLGLITDLGLEAHE